MALTAADLKTIYSAVTYDQVRKDSLWMTLTDQRWTEEWVNGAASVKIPIPTFAHKAGNKANSVTDAGSSVGIEVADRNRAGSWGDLSGVANTSKDFTRSGGKSAAQFIGYEDQMEAPWDVVGTYRDRVAYEIRNAVDTAIIDALRGYPDATTELGSNANFIAPSGAPSGTGRSLVREAIKGWADLCEERDLNAEASDAVGAKYAVMHPRLFANLRDELEEEKLSWDELTQSLLVSNSVLAGRGYRGRLYGIDIFSSNKMPLATTSATKGADTLWQVLCGTKTATAANIRPPLTQMIDATENQITDEPGYVFRQNLDYGVLELDGAARMQSYTIRVDATV